MQFLKKIGLSLLYFVFRFAFSLRYRVHMEGFKEIAKSKKKGILFLPNHPAEMDPLMLILLLWPKFKPRPLAVEHFYYVGGIHFFMNLVKALPLPTIDVANQWKIKQVEKLRRRVIDGLKAEENFLIYPSGKLKHTSEEIIGGASFIPDLLREYPEVEIVLIRTTGLWGSTFSRAVTGTSPDFVKTFLHGLKVLLKNGIFFAPKRHIQVEMTFAPDDFPRMQTKLEINKWLEQWYNKVPDPLNLVSFAFWKEEYPLITAPKELPQIDEVPVPEERRKEIVQHIAKISSTDVQNIKPNLHLANDLGLDSLDVASLYIFLEERFDIEGIAQGQLHTVGDVLQAAVGVKKEDTPSKRVEKKSKWPFQSRRLNPKISEGKTLAEVFLRTCDRMGGDATACADGLSGVLSYRKFKRGAFVLSEMIRQMPGDKIGILLPSSVAAYLIILATLLADKVPVMLNWTAGVRNLEHAVDTCDLKVVLSSYRFLSRMENGDLGKIDDILVLLEEVKRNIPLKEKLKGLVRSFFGAKSLIKKLDLKATESDPAVIIFTSGTETLPKGVPLTHANLLSNLRNGLTCVSVNPNDILYGVLPPFHSFGFSITGMLALLSGVKVCYAPDPTDSKSLANDIQHWKPTIFCSAPSFVSGLMRVASKEQLQSLRLIVTGAEKAPKELVDKVQSFGIEMREGYGISECSPIVTLEREGDPHHGVGRPIPETELCVINTETEEILSQGEQGEICIHGPGVFLGYLGENRNPFIELEGKRWYRSGDRGYIDTDGTLVLTGRLKRFVKIGGEMISLGGIEEDLLTICLQKVWLPEKIEGPVLAVAAKGRESEKPQIVLFATFDLDRAEVNNALKEMGHGRLVKIAEIRKIDEIPLTGTGKTQYRVLEEQLET